VVISSDRFGRATFWLRVELVRRELEMPNDRPSLVFFSLIGASLCAAVILIALLVAGDVAGPRVARNNLPPITAR
jgi:hypothetical protein